MRAGRVVLLIAGVLTALIGLGTAAAGAGALWAQATHRDADGYLTTPSFRLETSTRAILLDDLELVARPGTWTWRDRIDLRLTVDTTEHDRPVFLGVAPRDDVRRYLSGSAYDELERLDLPGARFRNRAGLRALDPPGDQDFWVASTDGSGTLSLTWTAEPGSWSVVVMNADASPGLRVVADGGARTDLLVPIGIGLLLGGLALLGAGTAMIIASVAGVGGQPSQVPVHRPAPGDAVPSSPVMLTGHLSPELRRWRWLVKWLLLIPHIIVLMLLWVAFVVLTIVAGVAILFTGRYPPALFSFNVGVLRWTWRVSFYGYSVLGTDRYPPFTLEPTDHPAQLDVVYPERLSRVLVLFKWWLLVLPHYLVVAILTGGGLAWTIETPVEGSLRVSLGGGLIGLLAVIAGLTLLVTARYPRGLFDLLMGFNRWVYRVVAYAALMTDEYPPFRLDPGGDEPRPVPPPPPPTPHDTGVEPVGSAS
jgi:hypothetical protein